MKKLVLLILFISALQLSSQVTLKGPSSSQNPYMLPTVPASTIISVLTAADTIGNYVLSGPPDGLGVLNLDDSTFNLYVNQEISASSGVVRAHGSTGSFISKFRIRKKDLKVLSGSDLIQNVHLWNGLTYSVYNQASPSSLAAMTNYCSADLPPVSAFYNSKNGKGSQVRFFMNGEEFSEGRAFAHILTGTETGHSYELPALGKYAYENAVANPHEGDKTLVAGLDDSSPGELYFYQGTKTNSGLEIDKAGLSNGKLYGLSVINYSAEIAATAPAPNSLFQLIDLGNVSAISGASLNSLSTASGVTSFLRPEDGAWDPNNDHIFYFNTTSSFGANSRLWKVVFNDIEDLSKGGTITAVLDGSEGQQMLDNIDITKGGSIYLQEDPGDTPFLARMWKYEPLNDQLKMVAKHDTARFIFGMPQYLTQNEESSGIVDAGEVLGAGWLLLTVQAHYSIPGAANQGGQLLAFYDSSLLNGLNQTGNPQDDFVLIPNPVIGKAKLKFAMSSENSVFNLRDLYGKLILESTVPKQTLSFELDLSVYPAGAYMVSLESNGQVQHKKLILLH